jgi:hypothetical protein
MTLRVCILPVTAAFSAFSTIFLQSSLPPLSGDIPARIAAAAALSVQTLTNTSYSKVSTVNGFIGQYVTEPNCYVNALLSWVAPSHRAVLPIDVDATWPKLARGSQMYTYFLLLAGSPTQSNFWQGVADLSAVAAGDVLASPYTSSAIGPGFAAIVSGKPVRLPSSATFAGGAAAALGLSGSYQLWDIPIITALPAASLLAKDTRCAGCTFAEGLGNGTLRAYVSGGAVREFCRGPLAAGLQRDAGRAAVAWEGLVLRRRGPRVCPETAT